MTQTKKKKTASVMLFACLAAGILLAAPFVGIIDISFSDILADNAGTTEYRIFWQSRVPRVLTTFLAGAALSVAGMCFQALFRNPLATPFILGVSSGASLGVALYVRLGLVVSLWWISGSAMFAFLGAILALVLVYGLTTRKQVYSTYTMLLAGVAVNFFFSSLIMFLQYVSDFANSFRIMRWLMGGIEVSGFGSVTGLAVFVLAGTLIALRLIRELDLITVGEDFATSRGINVRNTRKILFITTSLMTGAVVSVCGPIGFVGMICPHICRLLVGPGHQYLMPATFLFGGTFLTLCDSAARTLVAPAEIPVGVITALLGGPFFLWLLLTRTFHEQ